MTENESIIIFTIDNQKFGLPIQYVIKVIPVMEIRRLPGAPIFVTGIINLHGKVVPVVDVRILFGLSTRSIELSDQLIIIDLPTGVIAMLVDNTLEMISVNIEDMVSGDSIEYGNKFIVGVLKQSDGLIVINDVESFFSRDELVQLESALNSLCKKRPNTALFSF